MPKKKRRPGIGRKRQKGGNKAAYKPVADDKRKRKEPEPDPDPGPDPPRRRPRATTAQPPTTTGPEPAAANAAETPARGPAGATFSPADALPPDSRKNFIVFTYVHVFDAPPETEWGGHDGAISQIIGHAGTGMDNNKNRGFVRTVLEEYVSCLERGVRYDPAQKNYGNAGRPVVIRIDSYDAHFIADKMEDGLGIATTHSLLNDDREDRGLGPATVHAVTSCHLRMGVRVITSKALKQGSAASTAAWSRARFNWTAQLLIRMSVNGKRKWDPDLAELQERGLVGLEENEIPAYFRYDLLTPFDVKDVVWWDETHAKVMFGSAMLTGKYKMSHYRYPRGADGRICLDGEVDTTGTGTLRVKYPEEARMCLGVTSNLKGVSKKAAIFDYTGQVLTTQKDTDDLMASVIASAREGKGSHHWVSKPNSTAVYKDSPLSKLSKKLEPHLGHYSHHGICDIQTFIENALDTALPASGLQMRGLQKLVGKARGAVALGDTPPTVDHRKPPGGAQIRDCDWNPYRSKFGADWGERIKNTAAMKKNRSVRELFQHIVEESKRLCGEGCFFYHDALSLMTSKETRDWARQEGHLKHWILPEQGLNKGTDWEFIPCGNSPEYMPLDSYLNKDLKDAVNRHVAVTKKIPMVLVEGKNKKEPEDKRKFMKDTPVRLMDSFKRCWGVAPALKRIEQDIKGVIKAMFAVLENKGALTLDGRNKQNGHRRTNMGLWGGKRTKLEAAAGKKLKWHPDAAGFMKRERKRLNKSFNQIVELGEKEAYGEAVALRHSTAEDLA
jgi:hypothetical protein